MRHGLCRRLNQSPRRRENVGQVKLRCWRRTGLHEYRKTWNRPDEWPSSDQDSLRPCRGQNRHLFEGLFMCISLYFHCHCSLVQEVTCLEFHPTETLLASGSRDYTIKFFDYSKTSAKKASRTITDSEQISSISFHPSGSHCTSVELIL